MIKPDEVLSREIRDLGRLNPPDRNTKLRAGAATLSGLSLDGLTEMLREHGRAVTAVVVAGTMLREPDRHATEDIIWAREVAKLYGDQIRSSADTKFHVTYLWKFIEPMARMASA